MGESFGNPNPHIQGTHMNRSMAAKLSSLPCFGAFGVILCPDVCSDVCLLCGGWESLARFCNKRILNCKDRLALMGRLMLLFV